MALISASHILVEHEHEALDLLKKIEEGNSFESLAQQFSMCPSGKQAGGHLGEFGPGQMVAPFETATLALSEGEVSGPVQTQFGYHLIKRH